MASKKNSTAAEVERLKANRDALDAEAAERRRAEDAALAAYAKAGSQLTKVDQARDKKIADAQQRIDRARTEAEAQKQAIVHDQAQALAQIKKLGQSAQELSNLFGLPVKKVRALLQQVNTRTSESSASAVASTSTPTMADPR